MEDIINRIIEIDTMQRDLVDKAESIKAGTEKEIEAQKAKIYEEQMAIAEKRIEEMANRMREAAEKRFLEEIKKSQASIERMNEIYEKNVDNWSKQLFDRVIANY